MGRRFYSCVVCQPEADYCEWIFDIIQNEKAFVFHEDSANHEWYYKIKPGDIIILSYKRNFVAYGEALGIRHREDDVENKWTLSIPIKQWYFFNEGDKAAGISRYGVGFSHSGSNRDLIKQLDETFGLQKLEQINGNTQLYKNILLEKQYNLPNMDTISILRLLEYKKQIILQGPPGSGKTYAAKEMAKVMTQPKSISSSFNKVDEFFKNYEATTSIVIERRKRNLKLLNDFQKQFPKGALKSLSLDDYCIGTGTNNSFCWWIERGLKPLGYYSPGTARSYLIYWSEKQQAYSKHGIILRDFNDDTKAMKEICRVLSDVVISKDPNKGIGYFGDSLLLKILNSYYPGDFFPINGRIQLENALKLFSIDPAEMNKFEMNKKLVELFNAQNKRFNKNVTPFEFMSFLFENFDMKSDIELQSNELIAKGEYKLIQFHPAYTYEDFVRGIVAKTDDEGRINYRVVNKVMADFAKKALDNPQVSYILIIDEINRANLPAVLGELIYALEYRYDKSNPDETTVESMYSLLQENDDLENVEDHQNSDQIDKLSESKRLKLPQNLYIIGTMNTADRSVGHIDYAIRRRFAFVDVSPSETVIDEVVKNPVLNAKSKNLYKDVEAIFVKDSIAPDFKVKDVQIGHSYFLADTAEQLQLKLEYEIKPILREYLKDGILLEPAEKKIDELKIK